MNLEKRWLKYDFLWSGGVDSRGRHCKYDDWEEWQIGPGRGQWRCAYGFFWPRCSPARAGRLQRRPVGVLGRGDWVFISWCMCSPQVISTQRPVFTTSAPKLQSPPFHTSMINTPAAWGEWHRKQTTNQEPRWVMRVYPLSSGAAVEGRRGEGSTGLFLFAVVNPPIIAKPSGETQGQWYYQIKLGLFWH